jgi:hypothetical protein
MKIVFTRDSFKEPVSRVEPVKALAEVQELSFIISPPEKEAIQISQLFKLCGKK